MVSDHSFCLESWSWRRCSRMSLAEGDWWWPGKKLVTAGCHGPALKQIQIGIERCRNFLILHCVPHAKVPHAKVPHAKQMETVSKAAHWTVKSRKRPSECFEPDHWPAQSTKLYEMKPGGLPEILILGEHKSCENPTFARFGIATIPSRNGWHSYRKLPFI